MRATDVIILTHLVDVSQLQRQGRIELLSYSHLKHASTRFLVTAQTRETTSIPLHEKVEAEWRRYTLFIRMPMTSNL
jgi:hypothetical protein